VAEEETDIDCGGDDRQSAALTTAVVTGRVESGQDLESGSSLESFGMKREMTWGGLLFIGLKILAATLV
jgi:hypothetical protein